MRAADFVVESSVEDLEKVLKKPTGYDAIDHMMQSIARKYKITPKKLHDLFVEKHGTIPDKWTKQHLDELQFLGSQCTKDCSGHRAGYAWSQSRGGKVAQSPFSPSFNSGSQLHVDGK
jgi:hypothetical protein